VPIPPRCAFGANVRPRADQPGLTVAAFAVAVGAFAGWWVIGLATLAVVRADLEELRIALVAPAVGSAVTVFPVFFLSNLGIPMADAGPPTLVAILALSLVVLARVRPRPPRAVAYILAIAFANLLLVGRPMWHFGLRWLANANTDMSYYVLSTTSILHHGILSPLDTAGLSENRDLATSVHALHATGIRVGAEVFLAAFSATTHLSPIQVFMPIILALNMCVVCATAALALQFIRKTQAALLAAVLIAVSPLATYGVVQQLLPQVWGLALAAALIAVLMRPELHGGRGPTAPEVALVSILGAGLFLVYCELGGLLSVSYMLYLGVLVVRRRVALQALLRLWLPPFVLLAVVANTFLPRELRYLASASGAVSRSEGIQLFGYAIVPTATAGVAGLRTLFAPPATPYMSISILVALVLAAFGVVAVVRGAWRGSAACVVVLGDVAFGALLAYKGSDFGLFKLFMYAQPFVAAAVASILSDLRRKPAVFAAGVGLVALILVQLNTQAQYVHASRNAVDLRDASSADLMPAFTRLIRSADEPVLTATDNYTLGNLQAAAAGDTPLYFISRNFFRVPWRPQSFEISARGAGRLRFGQHVSGVKVISKGRCIVAMPSGTQVVMNRRPMPEGSRSLEAVDCAKAENLLIFVASSRGQSNTLPLNRNAVSLWQLQPDPAFPRRTFAGFGRYALLQIIKPSPTVRLELEYSTSYAPRADGSFRLPPASVDASGRVRFPVVGEGAAHVFSPPVRPRVIGGQSYVLIDAGEAAELPNVPRPGLSGLWGTEVPLDPRHLTSYVRNISVVSESEYRNLRRPRFVARFPADLGKRNLTYSGIFEDGWVGARSYVDFAGGGRADLTVRADVLPTPAPQHLVVHVNGTVVRSVSPKPGPLTLTIDVPASRSGRRVELDWRRMTKLAAPDRRRAAARLVYIGFASAPASIAFPTQGASTGSAVGIFDDGWARQDSAVTLAKGPAAKLVLRAEVLRVPGRQHLTVVVDGNRVYSGDVAPGHFELSQPLPASPRRRRIELHWARAVTISPSDDREASARLVYIGVVRH
jgi:hypothetical protein